jgi:hypothetical protein
MVKAFAVGFANGHLLFASCCLSASFVAKAFAVGFANCQLLFANCYLLIANCYCHLLVSHDDRFTKKRK